MDVQHLPLPKHVFKKNPYIEVRYSDRYGCEILYSTNSTCFRMWVKRSGEIGIADKEHSSYIKYKRNQSHAQWVELLNSQKMPELLKQLINTRKKIIFMMSILNQLVYYCFANNIKLKILLKYDKYFICNKNNKKQANKMMKLLNDHLPDDLSYIIMSYKMSLDKYIYN